MSTERATETPTARTSTTARLSAVTKTVVVAYTDGAASETALRVAGFEAALRNTSLTVVHQLVGPEAPEVFGAATGSDGARHAATARVAEIVAAAAPNCKTEIRVVTRLIADELIESSRTASLVVVGATVAHPSTAVLFDSVSRAVTRRALCPTLLVHADATHDAGAAVVCGVDRSPASEVGCTRGRVARHHSDRGRGWQLRTRTRVRGRGRPRSARHLGPTENTARQLRGEMRQRAR
jgi:nucleotide-binding universal stress UspA family protein